MTENTPVVPRGTEYIAFYKGGAFDGQSERRVASAHGWDTEITALASVDGIETMLVYNAVTAREVGDQVQVTYVWDAADSDVLEDLEDRRRTLTRAVGLLLVDVKSSGRGCSHRQSGAGGVGSHCVVNSHGIVR